ncbi:MAG: hypothetical protein ABIQ88_23045 [Chitinophagaceae bacterium]
MGPQSCWQTGSPDKDILSLKSKIAADESKLTSMEGHNPNSIPGNNSPVINNQHLQRYLF